MDIPKKAAFFIFSQTTQRQTIELNIFNCPIPNNPTLKAAKQKHKMVIKKPKKADKADYTFKTSFVPVETAKDTFVIL
ncbi:MAG: hypothetical protein WC623_24145 [Pedobacter sp.]|uniref:hypothetical protein n=1 Tax=Pedobacter sp. TaxID=1411316 RepID=UPI003561D237